MAGKQGLKTFKAEEALKALTVDFFNEKACRDYVLRRLHPDGPQCPGCGRRVNNEISINNFWELRRCECKHCGKCGLRRQRERSYITQASMSGKFTQSHLFSVSGYPMPQLQRL